MRSSRRGRGWAKGEAESDEGMGWDESLACYSSHTPDGGAFKANLTDGWLQDRGDNI